MRIKLDKDWDGEWFAKTSESDENWYSEFFIPWTMVPMSVSKRVRKGLLESVSSRHN